MMHLGNPKIPNSQISLKPKFSAKFGLKPKCQRTPPHPRGRYTLNEYGQDFWVLDLGFKKF